MKKLGLLSILIIIIFSACSDIRIDEKKGWNTIFEKHGLSGGFELYDNNREIANYHNLEAISIQKKPGRTFDIFSSIIGIETSIVLDESKPIYWVSRMTDTAINKSNNLRQFFKEHNATFYRQLALEISAEKMKEYIDTAKYGNMKISNEPYWENGELLISADEQVGFMKKIYFNLLPNVSIRATTIMQSMMAEEKKENLNLYYQISPVEEDGKTNYWIVGFVESYNPLINPKTKKTENKVHPHFFSGYITAGAQAPTATNVKALLFDILEDYQIPVK